MQCMMQGYQKDGKRYMLQDHVEGVIIIIINIQRSLGNLQRWVFGTLNYWKGMHSLEAGVKTESLMCSG